MIELWPRYLQIGCPALRVHSRIVAVHSKVRRPLIYEHVMWYFAECTLVTYAGSFSDCQCYTSVYVCVTFNGSYFGRMVAYNQVVSFCC